MWEQLLDYKLVDDTHTYEPEEIKFMIKICENDNEYLKTHYNKIKSNDIKHRCFLISAACSKDCNIMDLIIEKFKININHLNYKGENCLIIACKRNQNLRIIKHIIEDLNVNIEHENINQNNCLLASCYKNPISS